jgi:glycosyltransferase involved in cell wall biosynthesis
MSSTCATGPAVICTIVAKNYLAYARTLAESFYAHHPGGRMFVLLVDQPEEHFDPAAEPFTVVMAEELGIPRFDQMVFRYSVLELSTAVKPFFLEHLFERHGLDHVIYLDPDIVCYRPLVPLLEPLRTHQIVLTPHLLDPLDDNFRPNEVDILQAGAYNLGCIGVAQGPSLLPFLRWWQRRLERDCVVDFSRGLFVDQRWIDLAPSLFSSVAIVRDPGCNVAYWNLTHRHVDVGEERTAGKPPLTFYHFSGISLDNLNAISRHQNRLTLEERPEIRPLFERYREHLLAHGHATTRTWPYSYANFDNGVLIPELARQLWRTGGAEERWPTPFVTYGEDSFFAWLNREAHPEVRSPLLVTNFALAIYRLRLDLQQAFPDILGAHRRAFVGWFVHDAARQHGLDDAFVQPLRECVLGFELARGAVERPGHPLAARRGQAAPVWGSGLPPQEEPLVGRPSLSRRVYYGIRNPLRRLGLHTAAKRILGIKRATWLLESMVLDVAEPPAPIRAIEPIVNALTAPPAVALPEPGVNIVGYFGQPTGVGEVSRIVAAALVDRGVPLARVDVSAGLDAVTAPYDSTLLCVNADMTPNVRDALGAGVFHGRRAIGFWHWETEQFPRAWRNRFSMVNEVWVASDFVRRALAPLSPVPVLTMRLPITVCPSPDVTRADFGLPGGRFLWLFAFDMRSSIERKNPLAVIEAYRRAFGASRAAHLVIKVNHLDEYPEAAARLRAEVEAVGGTLISRTLDRRDIAALYAVCDGYVSLHRSEGFGLTMAEAMALGKPVVATGYSGNLEFMSRENSYLVGYRLTTIEQAIGSYYRAGDVWAEPDVGEAADLMAMVVSDPAEAACRGARAAAEIRAQLAPDVIAHAVADRLDVLRRAARDS